MPAEPSITIDIAQVAARIRQVAQPGEVLLIGVTGSVAAGKTTFSHALKEDLAQTHRVATVSTDGFLLSNAVLTSRDLMMRKGFPETFDTAAMVAMMHQARIGPIAAPVYSHTTYDVDPALSVEIAQQDILIFEGLGLSPQGDGANPADALDLLIYIDAAEDDIERWFVTRFLGLWAAAEHNPASFYAQFRTMDEAQTAQFASAVWSQINLPNLRDHILMARDFANIVLLKRVDHRLFLVRDLALPTKVESQEQAPPSK